MKIRNRKQKRKENTKKSGSFAIYVAYLSLNKHNVSNNYHVLCLYISIIKCYIFSYQGKVDDTKRIIKGMDNCKYAKMFPRQSKKQIKAWSSSPIHLIEFLETK